MSFTDSTPVIKIGVIADTHVPDRMQQLDHRFLDFFRQSQVDAILHAGDISSPEVLAQLNRVAPVTAVQGNRDFMFRPNLPLIQKLTLGGLSIGLAHGHGGWAPYLLDKVKYMTVGYQYGRYRDSLLKVFPGCRVIVFGHTHHTVKRWENGQFLFNPGAAYPCYQNQFHPLLGLLVVYPGQQFEVKVVDF
jgi:putative phosphoesterase